MVTPAKSWAPDRGDMIWIDFNPQAGSEMKNEHPMLVLSTKAFNVRTGIVIGLPMTHATYNETNPFAIKYMGPKKDVGYVLTHQPKSFDWRARAARPHPWKQLPAAFMAQACEGLNGILDLGG
jgi:mRNA interferase MazF